MKISKNKLTRDNKNLTLMLEGNRKEVTRLSDELRALQSNSNELRMETRRMRDKSVSLARELSCYTQLSEMLSFELLTARAEMLKLKYDMNREVAPDTYKVPQAEAKVTGRHFDTIRSDKLV